MFLFLTYFEHIYSFWTYFIPSSSISIVNFEQVNAGWTAINVKHANSRITVHVDTNKIPQKSFQKLQENKWFLNTIQNVPRTYTYVVHVFDKIQCRGLQLYLCGFLNFQNSCFTKNSLTIHLLTLFTVEQKVAVIEKLVNSSQLYKNEIKINQNKKLHMKITHKWF